MGTQVRPKEGRSASQEIHGSQADESSQAGEIVCDDESKMGAEEESSLEHLAQS
jgi:hypothetical protein